MKKKYYLVLLLLAPFSSHAMEKNHHQHVNPFLAEALRHLRDPNSTRAAREAAPKNPLLIPHDDHVAFWTQTTDDIEGWLGIAQSLLTHSKR